jgi:hypothetical protein
MSYEPTWPFVSLAARLRPRIGDVVQWQAVGEVLELVKRFMQAKSSRPEGVYGPLLIRLLAAFERYLRKVIVDVVDQRSGQATTYDRLSGSLCKRNVALTGRILAAIDAPREHLALDLEALVDNLASCKSGSESFRLNSEAFSAAVTGTSPSVIEKALHNVDVTDLWDAVGGSPTLTSALGTKGARATGDRARERLQEMWRWRNHLAHGGDEDVAISESQLNDAVEFVTCFGDALDTTVRKQLASDSRRK